MEADFMYSDLIIKEEMHAKRINHVVFLFQVSAGNGVSEASTMIGR